MRIVQFTAENIKKLKVVSIKPDGSMVLVTGANGQGKSSILDAIFYALGGTKHLPSQPVRHGTEKAFVKRDLGEIVVTRRFTANGGTSLTVEAANGAKFASPQKMLDDLLGALTFDPLEFSRMQPKQQLETLRGLVKLDVDIDELDRLNKGEYDQRTALNRTLKELQATLSALPLVPGTTPSKHVDIVELSNEMLRVQSANENIQSIRRDRVANEDKANEHTRRATSLRAQAQKLLNEAETEDTAAQSCTHTAERGAKLPDPTDIEPLKQQIANARSINAAVDTLKRHDELKQQIHTQQQTIDAYTHNIDARTDERQNAIATAKMPIEGLTFGDGEVLFNDTPFSQASSAEQLKVSIAIAMAANPKLRVLRIRDGSLLDEGSLALVELLAEEHDFQVWVERVDTSGTVGIVIEDGSVVEHS